MKRTFYILVICLAVGISLPSCEKLTSDEYPIMEQYYAESVMLSTVSLDSVKSFSGKVDGYVTRYPEAKQHRRYAQIQKNIKAASIRFNITINYNWDGADTIYF